MNVGEEEREDEVDKVESRERVYLGEGVGDQRDQMKSFVRVCVCREREREKRENMLARLATQAIETFLVNTAVRTETIVPFVIHDNRECDCACCTHCLLTCKS